MAEPSMPSSKLDNKIGEERGGGGGDDDEYGKNDEGDGRRDKKKGGKYSFSKICPHKAFPARIIDRKQLKTQKDYVNFLIKKPLVDYPWYESAIPKHKWPQKPKDPNAQPENLEKPSGLQKIKRLPVTSGLEEEDKKLELDKYIVLEKEKIKKKKKKKPKMSELDFEIKVNKELEFLLGVMADAKEVLIQKAIDFEREKEENERRGKEVGDITILKNIIQGMMFKVMEEHEESEKQKEIEKMRELEEQKERERMERECGCFGSKKCPKKKKHQEKKRLLDKCPSYEGCEYDAEKEAERQLCLQKQKTKEQTTKELVSFLKDLIDAEQKKREIVREEKAISPYVSEAELETVVYTQVSDEFLEEEIEEEEDEEEEEEEEGEGYINKDAEGYVDMDEVKKKLEELEGEDVFEDEENEYEDEEEGFLEGEFDEWIEESSTIPPLMQDVSAQFNYFLERKAVLRKEPKNITEDLAQFMRIVIMGDSSLREILKEKELVEFKRKQLDFMTMGMLIKRPKPCKCIKNNKKATKGKCKCKCCTKKKGHKGRRIECGEDKDLTYNVRPNEFMLMLQVLMNTLEVIEEQDRLLQPLSEPSSVTTSEASVIFIPTGSDQDEEEEEEETDVDDDVDDDDDVD